MNLRTELHLKPSANHIQLNDGILLLGSCFSENIGHKLITNKFKALINPFGTIYNPHSIFNVIEKSLQGQFTPEEKKIIFNQGLYRYLDFHSAIAAPGKEEFIEQCRGKISQTGELLTRVNWIVLTFGTAVVYRYKETGSIAANNHKLPADRFMREWMQVDDILKEFEKLFASLATINMNFKIMLTVSPVRHLKEGFEDNQVSKSILRLATAEIIKKFPNVHYFPSYEIVMDDLRDYRFYNEDLLHPNSLAIEYIWTKFCESYMDDDTRQFIAEWKKILTSLNHRPLHPDTDEYRQFVKQTVEKLQSFKNKINVEEEIKRLISK